MAQKLVNATPEIRIFDSVGHILDLETIEKEVIQRAITRYSGNLTECAERLGVGRSTLYRKIKQYQISV